MVLVSLQEVLSSRPSFLLVHLSLFELGVKSVEPIVVTLVVILIVLFIILTEPIVVPVVVRLLIPVVIVERGVPIRCIVVIRTAAGAVVVLAGAGWRGAGCRVDVLQKSLVRILQRDELLLRSAP